MGSNQRRGSLASPQTSSEVGKRRGWNGHFLGYWARLNCESIPVIPAWLVRRCVDDPRRIRYLLLWKEDGKIKEAVRLGRDSDPHDTHATNSHVELKRADGSSTVLRFVWRALPRNGGRALMLLCSYCNTPRRHVYGWEWDSGSGWSNRVRRISWRCRSCARLRYSSEGGYLCCPGMFRALGNLPRPESWLPYVFTSIDDPQRDRTAESPLSARKGGKERNREAGREVIPLESHTGAGVRGSLAHLKALRVVLL